MMNIRLLSIQSLNKFFTKSNKKSENATNISR